jgi:hypothetical protein
MQMQPQVATPLPQDLLPEIPSSLTPIAPDPPLPPISGGARQVLESIMRDPRCPHCFRIEAAKIILRYWPESAQPVSCVIQIPDMGL